MENDRFQELVLEQMKMLMKSVDTLAVNQEIMQQDINEMKVDINEMKVDIAEMKIEIAEMKIEIAEMKSDITNLRLSQVGLENKFDSSIKALFDDREVQNERLDRLEAKIDVLQMETAHLKRIK